jgi:hypothetical protein
MGAGTTSLEDLVKAPTACLAADRTLQQFIEKDNYVRDSPKCWYCYGWSWPDKMVKPRHIRAAYLSLSSKERAIFARNDELECTMRLCKYLPEPSCGHVHPAVQGCPAETDRAGGTLFHSLRDHGWLDNWLNLLRFSKRALQPEIDELEQSRFILSLVRSHRRYLTLYSLQGTYAVSVVCIATSSALRRRWCRPKANTRHLRLRAAATLTGELQRSGAGAQPG